MLLFSLIGFVLLLLCELALRVEGRRADVERDELTTNAPKGFGISDMIPDRHPINQRGTDQVDLEAWAEVRTAILDRLGEVYKGEAENFCWVSHEAILDGEGYIADGGLVAVVQKLAVFRVNFYRMKDFRTWVSIKKLDIGSNKRFADEQDVWVVRLTDKSQTSKEPLPSLDADNPQATAVAPERLERAEFMRSDAFARAYSIPRAGQEQLIPSLAPQAGEAFSFDLQTSSSGLHKKWRWTFKWAHAFGIDEIVFDNKTVLEARRPKWPPGQEWTVSDASFPDLSISHRLFTVRSNPKGTLHRVMTLPSPGSPAETLFVIRIGFTPNSGWVSSGRQTTMTIFNSEEDRVLYKGVTASGPPDSKFFMYLFSGSDTEDYDHVVGTFTVSDVGRVTLQVIAFADAALLLVATALLPDEG